MANANLIWKTEPDQLNNRVVITMMSVMVVMENAERPRRSFTDEDKAQAIEHSRPPLAGVSIMM